jgi:hypothetical protein
MALTALNTKKLSLTDLKRTIDLPSTERSCIHRSGCLLRGLEPNGRKTYAKKIYETAAFESFLLICMAELPLSIFLAILVVPMPWLRKSRVACIYDLLALKFDIFIFCFKNSIIRGLQLLKDFDGRPSGLGNIILGRASTPEEIQFLLQPGFSF